MKTIEFSIQRAVIETWTATLEVPNSLDVTDVEAVSVYADNNLSKIDLHTRNDADPDEPDAYSIDTIEAIK